MAKGSIELDDTASRRLVKLWTEEVGSRREFAKKLAKVKNGSGNPTAADENAADTLLKRLEEIAPGRTRSLTVPTAAYIAKTLNISREELVAKLLDQPGGILSTLSTKEYFDLFFDYINSGQTQKKVRIFARWLHFEIRETPLPEGFFQRFVEPFKKGLIDIEYVFFLTRPSSIKKSFVKRLLGEYCQFASEVRIHYLSTTTLEHAETSHTIAIWEGYKSYFTHEWDLKSQIYNLTEWSSEREKERLSQIYEKIKSAGVRYFRREPVP